jgi:hypothetical protein
MVAELIFLVRGTGSGRPEMEAGKWGLGAEETTLRKKQKTKSGRGREKKTFKTDYGRFRQLDCGSRDLKREQVTEHGVGASTRIRYAAESKRCGTLSRLPQSRGNGQLSAYSAFSVAPLQILPRSQAATTT